ncbi:hypothetical protein [Clostridioides sp. ZZV15-6597]|uniref:hypothetical protein n=1 Tax=Clostridioides sp. ZZV15-6597 TaxID=2811500 RepID=UPI001D128039|nr:hypothetical protein [Clostridioides sp. ZZV15-6597]HBF1820624.1 hypothetical protein [Clostridioides difficile]
MNKNKLKRYLKYICLLLLVMSILASLKLSIKIGPEKQLLMKLADYIKYSWEE